MQVTGEDYRSNYASNIYFTWAMPATSYVHSLIHFSSHGSALIHIISASRICQKAGKGAWIIENTFDSDSLETLVWQLPACWTCSDAHVAKSRLRLHMRLAAIVKPANFCSLQSTGRLGRSLTASRGRAERLRARGPGKMKILNGSVGVYKLGTDAAIVFAAGISYEPKDV